MHPLEKTDRNQLDSKLSMFDNIIFEICDDVLNNYNIYEDLIKIQIPNLIVDVVAICIFQNRPLW